MKDAISKDKLLEGIKNIDILYVYIKSDNPSRHIRIGGIDTIEFTEGVTEIPDEVYYWENGTDEEVRARLYEYIQSMFNAMPNCYIYEYEYNRR